MTAEAWDTTGRRRWTARLAESEWLWAWLGAALLALVYGRVAVAHLTTGLVGGNSNGYEDVWNDYWLREALFHLHRNPFFTNYLFYPTGVSLRFHTLNPFGGLLALPLAPLLGPVGAMNAKFLLALWGAVFFAWLLFRDATGSGPGAFAGAALYGLASDQAVYYFNGGAENYLMGTALLPLFLFFTFRATEQAAGSEQRVANPAQPWRFIVAAVLALLALSLTDWQYTLFAVLVTGLYFLWTLGTRRTWAEKGVVFLRLAIIGGAWLAIVTVPMLLPMLHEAQRSPWLNVSGEATTLSRALSQFVTPGTGNPGYLALIVTVVGLVLLLRRGAARGALAFWSLTALVGSVVSLGPRLKVTPERAVTNIPLPYALLTDLPAFSVGRRPQLFYFIALLGFGALLAFAMREILRLLVGAMSNAQRATRRRGKAAMPDSHRSSLIARCVLTAALVVGMLAPFAHDTGGARAFPLVASAFYTDVLAKDPDHYAILELPLFAISGRGDDWAALQSIHGKYVFDGSLSRDHKLESPNIFAKRATYFRDYFWLGKRDTRERFRPTNTADFLPTPQYGQIGVPLLNYYHVRYIVLWLHALDDLAPDALDTAERTVHDTLGADAKPAYDDGTVRAYRVPNGPPLAQPVFLDTGSHGWYAAEKSPDGTRYRWADSTDGAAELLVWNLSGERRRVTIQGNVYNYRQPRAVDIAINGYAADHFDLASDAGHDVSLALDIPPGLNVVTLSSPQPSTPVQSATDHRLLSFGVKNVHLVSP